MAPGLVVKLNVRMLASKVSTPASVDNRVFPPVPVLIEVSLLVFVVGNWAEPVVSRMPAGKTSVGVDPVAGARTKLEYVADCAVKATPTVPTRPTNVTVVSSIVIPLAGARRAAGSKIVGLSAPSMRSIDTWARALKGTASVAISTSNARVGCLRIRDGQKHMPRLRRRN